MIEKMRRLVSGEPGPGTEAVWTHAEEIEPAITGEIKHYDVWGWDEHPTLPYYRTEPYEAWSIFPPPGGVRVTAVEFPPGDTRGGHNAPSGPPDPTFAKRRELSEAVPHGRLNGSRPGMHRTDTIDIGLVLSGEVITELEGGAEQTLRPGDVYIQNGAMHAWRNDSGERALIVFITLPAERTDT